MKADERRRMILEYVSSSRDPVPGSLLREKFGVSRQVIVQDIALLRAEGHAITSTNRGYVAGNSAGAVRVFKCRHTLDELPDEGKTVIGLGGVIQDVFVNHRVYGKISAPLNLGTDTDVEELYRSLRSGASKPLMSVTDGYHYHTVKADSEEVLDGIGAALKEKGYLVEG